MKKAVLFLLSLAILPQAHAEKVVFVVGDQSLTQFSLINQEQNAHRAENYRIDFNGSDTAKLTTPENTIQVTPQAIRDSRPWDGCLVLQLNDDLELNECTHDGPPQWYLKSKSTDKIIKLKFQIRGNLQVEGVSK